MRWHDVCCHAKFGRVKLARVVAGLKQCRARPMSAALTSVQPHLHIFLRSVMVQGPAHLQNESGPVGEAHESSCELLNIHVTRHIRWMPDAERAFLSAELSPGYSTDADGSGVAHHPQQQVQDVHLDVDAGTTTRVTAVDERRCRNVSRASQHPASP